MCGRGTQGSVMQKVLLFVDKISTWVGHAFSFLIIALTLHVTWEVFRRYVLDSPRAWAFDGMIMLYGTLFMMAGAYTLAKNGRRHPVRLFQPAHPGGN